MAKRRPRGGGGGGGAGAAAAAAAAGSSDDRRPRRKHQRKDHQKPWTQHQQQGTTTATSPSAAFLTALEEQRERERQRQASAQPSELEASVSQAGAAKPRSLVGFYFDEAQRRYFRLTPQIQRARQQQKVREREASARLEQRNAQGSCATASKRTSLLRGATPKSWLAYVARRESSVAWSVGRRDKRELVPLLFASRVVR